MPTNYIKKLAKDGKGSVAELEGKWETAKAAAKQGKADNFAYITGIFQTMIGASANEIDANTAYIDSLVEEGKGTKEELTKKWEQAIGIANKEGIQAYPYAVAVFQHLIGIRSSVKPLKTEAAARLKASK